MWKQRSHVEWLKKGDHNIGYFHCRANQRNKHNYILGFEDETGNWVEDDGRMGEMVEAYFTNIFTTSNPSDFDEVLDGVLPTVTKDMNANLNWPFTVEKVYRALHQMAPLIAPSFDGISQIFYKSFQHIVGCDVTKATLSALNLGVVPESINTTFIAFIPKIMDPKKVFDFRPISLCKVIYKLIAEVLVNHLKLILPYVVFDTHSAFLLG